jgi:hypothetical protein
MKVKFPRANIKELTRCREGEKSGDLELIDEGNWIDDGKYSNQELVFKNSEGKFYIYHNSRSGSYFSYYYNCIDDEPEMIECSEVKQVEVKTLEWKEIKD